MSCLSYKAPSRQPPSHGRFLWGKIWHESQICHSIMCRIVGLCCPIKSIVKLIIDKMVIIKSTVKIIFPNKLYVFLDVEFVVYMHTIKF